MNWVTLPDTEAATGYKLYMTNDETLEKKLIYDGSNNPNLLTYIVSSLSTG